MVGELSIEGAIRDVMIGLLRESRGDTRQVSQRLGISRSTVYARLERLGLNPADFR